jgi:UDPglucose--hexose-1-phosphate uridylyltransferase
MHSTAYVKPDGRMLWLYSTAPLTPIVGPIPMPSGADVAIDAHLRRHPLLQEWVIYASHRQDRTHLPSVAENPLAPTRDGGPPTELPAGDYEVAVFENRFPSLVPMPPPPPQIDGVETAPAFGRCEVIVFDQHSDASLSTLPVERLELILEVWADRTRRLREAGMAYVLPFENRGVEMGVTLTHPHGQIYAYGFLPRRQAAALSALRAHYRADGHDLVSALARAERERGVRVVSCADHAIAFAPPFARFPYELWVTPVRQTPDLAGLTGPERRDFAVVLSDALRRLDRLWSRPMPYLLTVNQAPIDGADHPEWTVRVEIWPIRRGPHKLKYLAGTELGAGVFACDVTPEAAAGALRAVDAR